MRILATLSLCLLSLAPRIVLADPPPGGGRNPAPVAATPIAIPIPVDLSTHARSARNTFYVEAGGSAFTCSVNYERFVSDRVSLRLGAGYDGTVLVVPMTTSYVQLLSGGHGLEAGLGVALARRFDPAPDSYVLGAAIAGYRFAPTAGGLNFRLALTPLVGDADPRTTYTSGERARHVGEAWLGWRVGFAAGWAF